MWNKPRNRVRSLDIDLEIVVLNSNSFVFKFDGVKAAVQ